MPIKDGILTIGPVIVAYPHLIKPRTSVINGKESTRYEAVILIPKDQKAIVEEVRSAIKTAFTNKFGSEAKLVKDKAPLKDGDESVTEDGSDAGKFPGYFYCNVKAWTDNPPQLKHADKTPITDPGAMTSGDWVYVVLKPRAYAFENTKGAALDILGARLVKKGTPIGGGNVAKAAVADALDSLEIEVEEVTEDDF